MSSATTKKKSSKPAAKKKSSQARDSDRRPSAKTSPAAPAVTSLGPRKSRRFRSGTVAILGRPNAGKSTLLNALMEVAVSPTSPRPQTTRSNVRGIVQLMEGRDGKTWAGQIVLIDTPGVNLKKGQLLDRIMIGSVEDAMADVDVAVWVADARSWAQDLRDIELEKPGADKALGWLRQQMTASKRALEGGGKRPRWILALSKVDLSSKPELLPLIQKTASVLPEMTDVVPIAAKLGLADDDSNLESLLDVLKRALPEGEPLYDAEAWTDLTDRTLIQNLVREAIFQFGRDEVPYECDCQVMRFLETSGSKKMPEVDATIWVGKKSLKPILVGAGGSRIREINHQVRARYREITGEDIVLRLVVKVNENWFLRPKDLQELGYDLAR